MKQRASVIAFVVLLVWNILLPTFAFSRKCDKSEYDKAEYFTEKAGIKLVDKFGGGSNVRVNMTLCNYNSYSGIFKTKVAIYWNGAIRGSREYNIDGRLRMTSDGTQSEFVETFANSNVKSLRFWGYVASGAVVLGVLISESD
ncbi:MAG: hypothetical protein D3916_03950 [Candidatus Electrothrix sp. MAN1_4]|nr:hypothetical protein [Candidatus Electrothrix sp. MAN1_4]